jgi:hypothetical protein
MWSMGGDGAQDYHVGDLVRLRPRPDDVAALGAEQARVAAVVRLANSVTVAVALALLMVRMLPVSAAEHGFRPWAQRDLVIVDETDDPSWHQATRHAVEVWNHAGADLRLTWATGEPGGECRGEGVRIAVCPANEESLEGIFEFQGRASQEPGGDHPESAFVEVCTDCGLDDSLRRVVVTHEIGHALGLPHSSLLGSVMYPTGGTHQPADTDYADLRALYPPTG